jgi:hypothetical protein
MTHTPGPWKMTMASIITPMGIFAAVVLWRLFQ